MKEDRHFRRLFEKYTENALSKEEYTDFMNMVRDPEYSRLLESLLHDQWNRSAGQGTNGEFAQGDASSSAARFRRILDQIPKGGHLANSEWERDGRLWLGKPEIITMAIAFLISIGSVFLVKYDMTTNPLESPSAPSEAPEAITLTLGDGEIKVLDTHTDQKISDATGTVVGTQKGNRLTYDKGQDTPEKLVYNELTVPYGKRFDLVLSDGTEVTLNAGSWIRYPVKFLQTGARAVFLTGEAYFDVMEDTGRPFTVQASDVQVEVLGTEFNMSFYPEDDAINTVLVEGSVRIYGQEQGSMETVSTFLSPHQKASWHRSDKTLSVTSVDTELYTAWKDGVLLFRKTPFNSIRKKLERHFDIEIRNAYEFLESQVYTASFEEESIYEILDAFRIDTPFAYEYDNTKNIIILTPE